MSNPYRVPELTAQEVKQMRENGDEIILLDVREVYELAMADLGEGVVLVPLSRLAQQRLTALPEEAHDKDVHLVVFCHHGIRSAQVVAWLQQEGWSNVWNLRGGIDAYAREVDPSIGFY